MRTLTPATMYHGTERSGASAAVYSCAKRQGQPSINLFAGLLPTDWEEAGP